MKSRNTARVLVIDQLDRLLLIQIKLPERPEPFWVTVGGAIEPGETFRAAMLRELAEETGIKEDSLQTTDCVWFGEQDLEFGDELIHHYEQFGVARVEKPNLCSDFMTEDEKQVCAGYKWWSLAELRTTEEVVYPPCLATLMEAVVNKQVPIKPVEISLK